MIFFIGFLILISIYYLWHCYFQLHITANTIVGFTGSLGTGKTYHCVKEALKEYRKERFLYFIRQQKYKPELFSNIPVKISNKWFFGLLGHEVWAKKLTRKHLLLEERLPERAILIIDEVGQFASQYDYNNPNVMEQFQELIRFYRHYTDGRLFITDQSSSNVVVPLRRRVSQVYNLTNMRRVMFFFYKVDVQIVELTEDITTIQMNTTKTEERPYFFGFKPFKLPMFKWINKIIGFKKYYDDRCYSINYVAPVANCSTWYNYKTNEFIDLSPTKEQVNAFKERKKGITM